MSTDKKKATAKNVIRKGILHKNCKLCALIEIDAGLWQETHDKILVDNIARSKVCRWLNSKIDLMNIDLPDGEKLASYNDENFARHFHNHIPTHLAVKRILADKALGKERDNETGGFSPVSKALFDNYVEESIEEQSDFSSITKMIATLETHMVAYNTYLVEKTALNKNQIGKRPIPLSELNEFRSMVEALTDLKLKVAKIRNSSAISGAAVRRAVSISVELFINHLVMALSEAELSLKEGLPGSTLPTEVIEKARNQIATNIKTTLPEILEKIFTEYGIK